MKQAHGAFIKFQTELKPIKENGYNPHFKSTFAELSGILKATLPLLNKHGLALIQSCRVQEGNTILQTRLIHESGEEILSEMILPFIPDAQKMGSLITYYKRYQLQAVLGVATTEEDDDGAGAGGNEPLPPNKEELIELRRRIKLANKTDAGVLHAINTAFKSEISKLEDMSGPQFLHAMKFFKEVK